MKYIVANLKNNKDLNSIQKYINDLRKLGKTNGELVICPPSCFLPLFDTEDYILGAQDVSKYPSGSGSHTGEISAKMLQSLNAKYVIIGHSERRIEEDSQVLISKIKNALGAGLEVIYCIGESVEENNNKLTEKVLEEQIATILNEFTREDIKNIIIAYEPVWSIGTGQTPSIIELDKTTEFINNIIKNYYEIELPIIYGGSISVNNIEQIMTINNIKGLLIGNSSLNIEELMQIIRQYFD